MNQDQEHLKLLSIFHYILGAITALCASFPIIHFIVGAMLVFAPEKMGETADQQVPMGNLVGWMFMLMGGAFVLGGWALGFAMIYAGRCLKKRERYTFCLVVAAISCLNMPVGTALGVFTIIVLMRPSVKELFGVTQPVMSN